MRNQKRYLKSALFIVIGSLSTMTARSDVRPDIPSGTDLNVNRGPEARSRSDRAIEEGIRKRLDSDRSLDDSAIAVKSVKDGYVLLSGVAASTSDRLRAIQCALRQRGALGVASEIEGPDTIPVGEFRIEGNARVTTSRSSRERAAPMNRQLLEERRAPRIEVDTRVSVRDPDIRDEVSRALADHGDLESADISIEVNDGAVRLTGIVPNRDANLLVLHTVRSVAGVRSVRNDLRVLTSD